MSEIEQRTGGPATIRGALALRIGWRQRVALLLGVVLFVTLIVWGQHLATQPQPPLPTVALAVGGHALHVEVATTPAARTRGLMFRSVLADDAGMLFVYEDDQALAFWMHNTSLPLSLAFLDAQGRIVQLIDMEPFDDTIHRSIVPARYALEADRGWFARHSIGVGDRAIIPPIRTPYRDDER
jgi:uncharacterized membrane protein (UPF0127 family)